MSCNLPSYLDHIEMEQDRSKTCGFRSVFKKHLRTIEDKSVVTGAGSWMYKVRDKGCLGGVKLYKRYIFSTMKTTLIVNIFPAGNTV